jgi:hypothetical protein
LYLLTYLYVVTKGVVTKKLKSIYKKYRMYPLLQKRDVSETRKELYSNKCRESTKPNPNFVMCQENHRSKK